MNSQTSIQELVRKDLLHREEVGRQRYGTSLYAYNGRVAIFDAYEEALDLCCYLRQFIEEMNTAQAKREEPHHRAAREHADGECGWFCRHDLDDDPAKETT